MVDVEFNEVRGKILGKTILPNINYVSSDVCMGESCRNVMVGKKAIDSVESSALVTENITLKASNQSNKTHEKSRV